MDSFIFSFFLDRIYRIKKYPIASGEVVIYNDKAATIVWVN